MNNILSLVESELRAMDTLIQTQIFSSIPLAREISTYIFQNSGKRLRPILLILSAKLFKADPKAAIQLAAVIEMLHTAMLLHDDVIDESLMRRNQPSVNAKFGNEASVLVGDLLYAKSFQLITALGHPAITQCLSEATSVIVEGEILQLAEKHNPATTEETYLEIIRRKTGVLFRVAALTGALLTNASHSEQEAIAKYGESLGTAFQMQDDALDYIGDADIIGKNLGDDLAEGKPTLPLIYALKLAAPEDQIIVRNMIEQGGRDELPRLLEILTRCGAITDTQKRAADYVQQALTCLKRFPNTEITRALITLANLSVHRTH